MKDKPVAPVSLAELIRAERTVQVAASLLPGALRCLAVLSDIADAYDANNLDDEARKHWGAPTGFENTNNRDPAEIELYTGRGGKRLLTLKDCLDARSFTQAAHELVRA